MADPKPTAKKFVLAKGKGLKIPGVSTIITNENVNKPNIIVIINRAEVKNGAQYFGRAIIEK